MKKENEKRFRGIRVIMLCQVGSVEEKESGTNATVRFVRASRRP
jgi:hypothetical protein